MLTQHFRACARADGSKPAPPDEFTVAFVGDRCVGRFDVTKLGRADRSSTRSRSSPGHPPRTTRRTLAQRQAEGLVRMCEIALAPRDRRRRRPTRRVSYLTHARTADDVTIRDPRPLLRGDRPPRTGPDPLRRDHRARHHRTTGARSSTSDAPPRSGTGPNAGPSPPAAPTANGPDVRSPPPGATSTTSISLGTRRRRPTSPTVPTCVEDTTCSSTNTATGHYTFDHQHFRVYRADGTEVHPDAWHDLNHTDMHWAV